MENKFQYVLNLEKIMEFVFANSSFRNTDSEITESYNNTPEEGLSLVNKIIREVKQKGDNSTEATIRYDLIKLFITSLLEMPMGEEDEMFTTIGDTLIVNTMLNENFLSVIKLEDNGKE